MLTIESLDLESSFLTHTYIFRVSRSRSYVGHPLKFKVTEAKHVSVCPVWALNFERLYLQSSFLCAGKSSEYMDHVRISGHRIKLTVKIAGAK